MALIFSLSLSISLFSVWWQRITWIFHRWIWHSSLSSSNSWITCCAFREFFFSSFYCFYQFDKQIRWMINRKCMQVTLFFCFVSSFLQGNTLFGFQCSGKVFPFDTFYLVWFLWFLSHTQSGYVTSSNNIISVYYVEFDIHEI